MPTHFAYTQRFNAVLAYIDANLEGDLSVKTLSGVANFSAFSLPPTVHRVRWRAGLTICATDAPTPCGTSPGGRR
jgi:hypothetical protein